MLVHIPDDKTACTVAAGIVQTMRQIPRPVRRSLMWDRGTEMAEHDAITQATGLSVYFCDSASPWHKATNENANGLLRQYFPKGTDLSVRAPTDLRFTRGRLNPQSLQRPLEGASRQGAHFQSALTKSIPREQRRAPLAAEESVAGQLRV